MDGVWFWEGEVGQQDTAVETLLLLSAPTGQTAPTHAETLVWDELSFDGKTYLFNKGLTIRVSQEDGGCSFSSDEYGLLGFGHTMKEAELSFCADFATQWEEIACEDDDRLTKGAIDLKHALLGLVKVQA
jgi:hypothetical protein